MLGIGCVATKNRGGTAKRRRAKPEQGALPFVRRGGVRKGYVFHNARRHGLLVAGGLDAYCSGWWFDGWKETFTATDVPERPTAEARTWLLQKGWRRHRLLRLDEVPGRRPKPDKAV